MRPVGSHVSLSSPVYRYPYAEARAALAVIAAGTEIDARNGYKLEYINPQTGGPALPTISTCLQLLPAGFHSSRRRSTEGAILCVKEGNGRLITGDGAAIQVHDFAAHDVLVIPNWVASRIEADAETIIFWASDRGPQTMLGFYREE